MVTLFGDCLTPNPLSLLGEGAIDIKKIRIKRKILYARFIDSGLTHARTPEG